MFGNSHSARAVSPDTLRTMSDHMLIQEAGSLLYGQISPTPETELALVLLDRLEYTMQELDDARAMSVADGRDDFDL